MRSEGSASAVRPVVVGVDGSRNHLSSVDLAVAEAAHQNAPLLIVHVWPGRYVNPLRTRGPLPVEADGARLLAVAARRAAHRVPDLDISTRLVRGSVSAVLVRESAAARLMVVGHRDELPARASWGSTAAYLAHHTRCPLLVNRGAAPDHGPVVLAASARPAGAATVACAYDEAARWDARLVAVHVCGRPDDRASSAWLADRRAADRQLAEALAGWSWTYPDVAVERLVLHDLDLAYTLERASRRGRLLVAGIGHDGRFAELLYGSFSSPLMRGAPCPVLLVPPDWPVPLAGPAPVDVAAADPS